MLGRRQEINLQVYQLLDLGLLTLCLWLSHRLRIVLGHTFFPSLEEIPPFGAFFWVLAIVAPLTPIFLEMQGFYDGLPNKSLRQSLWQLLGALVWIGVLTGFCEVFLHWRVHSRSVLILQIFLGGTALLLREAWVKQGLRRRMRSANRERVLLAGEAADMDRLLQNMTLEQGAEIEVVGRIDITKNPVERLVELLHSNAVSRVIFAVRHAHFSRIEAAVQACETEGVEAWLSADFFQTAISRPTFDVLGGKLMLVFRTIP
jgi:FlaA1/EpsC-like NDP-sugar epimerase